MNMPNYEDVLKKYQVNKEFVDMFNESEWFKYFMFDLYSAGKSDLKAEMRSVVNSIEQRSNNIEQGLNKLCETSINLKLINSNI